MKLIPHISAAVLALALAGSLFALQRGGTATATPDDSGYSVPPDNAQHAEWVFARFRYELNNEFGGLRGFQTWAAHYPQSDREFASIVHRLTRLDAASTEQVVEANSDDLFNWPWLFVEDAGSWRINDQQAGRLRDYLLKGGFVMLDDTHGDAEWANLAHVLHSILPGRAIEDIPDDDEIFHALYDLGDRFQIPGTRFIWKGTPYTPDKATPKWRGIRDDDGRIMVVIVHNSDVGDAWALSDNPKYPVEASSLAFKLGINFIIYGMTH